MRQRSEGGWLQREQKTFSGPRINLSSSSGQLYAGGLNRTENSGRCNPDRGNQLWYANRQLPASFASPPPPLPMRMVSTEVYETDISDLRAAGGGAPGGLLV